MSILKFSIPADSKIVRDINLIVNSNTFKFIGNGSVTQTINETVFTRKVQVNNDPDVKKVVYRKKGFNWGFVALEEAAI